MPGNALVVQLPPHYPLQQFLSQTDLTAVDAILDARPTPQPDLDIPNGPPVLTPLEAKGLEYQNVAVIGTAETIKALHKANNDTRWPALDARANRAHIDRLRVAVSRAADQVAFIENYDDAQHVADLLQHPSIYDIRDYKDALDSSYPDPTSTITIKAQRAEHYTSNHPKLAWNQARQIYQIIDQNPSLNQELTKQHLVNKIIYDVAIYLIVNHEPQQIPDDVADIIRRSSQSFNQPETAHIAAYTLHQWLAGQTSVIPFLNALTDSHTADIEFITRHRETFSEHLGADIFKHASNPNQATFFANNIKRWATRLVAKANIEDSVDRVVNTAISSLIQAERIPEAKTLIERHPPCRRSTKPLTYSSPETPSKPSP